MKGARQPLQAGLTLVQFGLCSRTADSRTRCGDNPHGHTRGAESALNPRPAEGGGEQPLLVEAAEVLVVAG